MFIQVIQGRCHDADRMRALGDEWADTLGRTAEGWLGGTYGLTDDDQFVAVVRFESKELASRNAERPEQGEWWQKMAACFDGDVTFHDCDRVLTFLDGGSDSAGFVQIIQGRTSDVDRMRQLMEQSSDALRALRPDVIGGTVALHGDGGFTQTVYFTSEAAAREGERKERPPELKTLDQQVSALLGHATFYDLPRPWLHSPR